MPCTQRKPLSCVHHVPIFKGLDASIVEHIEKVISHNRFNKNEHLFYEGDPSSALYIIHKGIIKIYKLTEDGKEQTVRLLFPGDFFGQSALVVKNKHSINAQVLDDDEICIIDQAHFIHMMNKHPEIVLRMFTAINERLHETDDWMTTISQKETEQRLAKLLILFHKKLNIKENSFFQLPFAKKELAPLIGSTRETVSRKLTKLVQNGIIETNPQREFKIVNAEKLAAITGEYTT